MTKARCMGRPVASSSGEISDSVRVLLAIGVNGVMMRFQKGGGREGSATSWMKAYEIEIARPIDCIARPVPN